MKIKEVFVGRSYMTKVGQKQVKVLVTERIDSKWHSKELFVCVRVDTGKTLPKYRSAASLHPVTTPA
jgi:hypothetical protein